MKLRKIQYCLGAAFLLIAAVVVTTVVHSRHREQKEYWKEVAVLPLRQIIIDEMITRGANRVPVYSPGASTQKPTDSVTITATSQYGTKRFHITRKQQLHNISDFIMERIAYSSTLDSLPLNADTLNRRWNRELALQGFRGKTITRVSSTDWWEDCTTAYSPGTALLPKSDSIALYYLGCLSEVEVTGYMYYPLQATLTSTFIMTILSICTPLFVLVVFLPAWVRSIRHKQKGKEIVYVPVQTVKQTDETPPYQIDQQLLFDANSQLLTWRESPIKLTKSQTQLLQYFLEAENFRLTSNQIMELMWQNGSGTPDKLYTNVSRLKKQFPADCGWTIVNETTVYRLTKTSKDNSPD